MKTTALLALAASLGEATAFLGFLDAKPFNCPENTDNKCDDRQKSGWDWSDLNPGRFEKYNDFDFKGWDCKDKFDKRDWLAPRTFGQKVISGTCGQDKKSSPSFGCGFGSKVEKFSIVHFDVSVEFDTDLEFHYDMPDGSACKHRAPCSRGGTTVKNTQCGGAKNVTIVYPPQPDKPKKTCGVGVHKVEFDCKPPVVPVPPKFPPKPSSSYQPPPPPPPSTSSTSTSTNAPSYETSSTLSTVYTSEAPQSTSASSPEKPEPEKPSHPPVETLPCPEVVPRCLNTWLFSIGCRDNTHTDCFCPDTAFVQNVFTCFYGYGETDIIISQAIIFFQGICKDYVPKNPAIVTCPETIKPIITVTAEPTVQAVYTTITVEQTTVVPCETNGSVIPGSSSTVVVQTTLSVPDVSFQTGDSGNVGVVPVYTAGSPPEVPKPTIQPVGSTGGLRPTTTGNRPQFTGAANKLGSGVGLGLVVMAALAL